MKRFLSISVFLLLLNGCASDGQPAAESTPQHKADIYTSLGTAYLENGHPREAVRELQAAIAADNGYPQAYNVMGLAYQQLNQPELARRTFRQALSLAPKNPEILNNYGAFLIGNGDYSEAVRILKKAAADPLYGTPQFAWTNLARAYLGLKQPQAARQAIAQALALLPNYAPALQLLAEMEYQDGKLPDAFSHLQVVLAQQPNSADALVLAGRIAAQQGQVGEARAFWKRSVDAAPYSVAGKAAQHLLMQYSGGGQ